MDLLKLKLIQQRTIRCPTALGWTLLFLIGSCPILLWWFEAESFCSLNAPLPAEVLVVEAWTGTEGAAAAAIEFKHHSDSYRYVVAAGGLTSVSWASERWNSSHVAAKALYESGIFESQIIPAKADDVGTQRTFKTAMAAREALLRKGIKPKAINVFTLGAHARRSRLVFAKVFGPETKVGVVCWIPPGYNEGPWWTSSERAEDLVKETIAYLYEALLGSGRAWQRGSSTNVIYPSYSAKESGLSKSAASPWIRIASLEHA